MTESLGLLGFLSVFHVIGGVAVGAAVRSALRHGISAELLFPLVWGGMFAGISLIVGVGLFIAQGTPSLVGVELLVLFLSIVIAAFTPGWLLESFDAAAILPVAMGGLFLWVGIGVGCVTFWEEPLSAILIGGLFSLVGGGIFVLGVTRVLRQKA